MSYMKRFYLRNSCMRFHPKMVMLTSIYLASKSENYPVSLHRFCATVNEAQKSNVKEALISSLEFGMVQSLEFELSVHGAQRALYGLILDLQAVDAALTRDAVTALANAVQPLMQLARLSDAEFLYAPTHIALGCCWTCVVPARSGEPPVEGKTLVRKWLDAREQRVLSSRTQERDSRDAWRRKKAALIESGVLSDNKRQPAESDGAANERADFDDAQLAAAPFGIPRADVESILDAVAAMIRAMAAGPDSTKPRVDLEHVKKLDLHLKECLALSESAAADANSRKRAASPRDGDAKRARFDDSDSEH